MHLPDAEQEILESSEQHARESSLALNPNPKMLGMVVKALASNKRLYGKPYCPCRAITGNQAEDEKIVCPCVFHWDEIKQDGHCKCRLFWSRDAAKQAAKEN